MNGHRGQAVDKRTDIRAFGCVLFEMLTARPAFAGATISDTIAAILGREPNWKELSEATPASIRRLLERSLQKDFKRRLRDVGDAQAEIDDSLTSSGALYVREDREVPGRRWFWGVALPLVVAGLGVGWTIAHFQRPIADIRAARLSVNPPAGTELRVAGEAGGAAISPDGRRFIDLNRGKGIYLGSLDRPQEKILLLTASTNAIYAPPHGANERGHLLWLRDGTLVAQPFDVAALKVTAQPAIVAEGVAAGAVGQSTVSVSNDGTIVYSQVGIEHLRLSWYSRDGKSLGALGQPERYIGLRISPDAKRVALAQMADIWQMDFARAIPTRVTFSGGVNNPVWSPDGQRIAYQKAAPPPPNLFTGTANGTGSEERLIESRDTLVLRDWSPDGRFLLYSALSNDISLTAQSDLWLLPLTGDRKPFPFLTTPFREGAAQFSPDGKWIAYTSNESGRNEVYVQSFPASHVKWPVSSNGGGWPRWRRDGGELFYVGRDRQVMSVEVRAIAGSLEFGTPINLFGIPVTPGENDPYPYDVMPDGQRFLALVPASDAETPPLTVIFNWQEEQSQRVTVK